MSQKPQQRSRSPAVAPAELRVSQARAPSSPTPAGSRSGAPRDSAERSSEALLDASDRGASGASSAAQTGRRSARDRRPVEEIGVDVQVKGEEISDGGTDASATADEPLFDKMSERPPERQISFAQVVEAFENEEAESVDLVGKEEGESVEEGKDDNSAKGSEEESAASVATPAAFPVLPGTEYEHKEDNSAAEDKDEKENNADDEEKPTPSKPKRKQTKSATPASSRAHLPRAASTRPPSPPATRTRASTPAKARSNVTKELKPKTEKAKVEKREERGAKKGKGKGDRAKRVKEESSVASSSGYVSDDEGEGKVYEVDSILAKQESLVKGKPVTQYRIKWLGYKTPTWEPVENLVDCRDAVAEFERKLAKGADVEKGRKRGREVEVEQEKEGKRKRGGATTSRGGKARR